MKFSQAFPSKYIKAHDLDGDEPVVTIRSVKMEKVGDDERPVLYFNEDINGSNDKGFILNKTNGNRIVNATGYDDMRKWVGLTIKLAEDEYTMDGQTKPTVKIKMPKVQPKAQSQAPSRDDDDDEPRKGAKSGSQKYQDKELDDEIPFSWLIICGLTVGLFSALATGGLA